MSRLLSLAILAGVLWIVLEIGWSRLRKAIGPKRPASPDSGEALVRCAACGVHVPRSRLLAVHAGLLCERCR